MTSKTSSLKKHPSLNLLRFTLKKQTPYTLLVTAFTLLICPGTLLKSIGDRATYYSAWDMGDYFTEYTVIIFIASVLLMLILLMVNFSFLFSKKSGDLFHALPLTRNELLFIRAFASYVGVLFNMTVAYSSLSIVNYLPGAAGVDLSHLVTSYLVMVLFATLLTAFSLLFVVVSGGFFDFIIAVGVVNAGLPGLYAVFANFFSSVADGFSTNYVGAIYTTPFAYTVYKLINHTRIYGYAGSTGIEKFSVWSVVGAILFTVVCILVSSKLFKIRKSETAGEAYSFKFVPNIISVILSAAGGYVIGYIITLNSFESFDFWLFFCFGAVLCSITFGAISSRGFKTIGISVLKAGIAVTLSFALVVGINYVGKQTASFVPAEDKIERIELYYNADVVFTDNFELVTDMHKQIIKNIENDYHDGAQSEPEIINNISELNAKYVMKNGRVIHRRYPYHLICRDNLYDDMLKLMQSDEFFAKYDKIVFRNNKTVWINAYSYKEFENRLAASISVKETEEILETYKKEMRAADLGIFGEDCLILHLENHKGGNSERIVVPQSFTETIAIIDALLPIEDVEIDEAVAK